MNIPLLALLTILGMIAGTLCMLELGRRLGLRRLARDPESAQASTGAIDGAVFGLLGLLIAFTFSGAATRFDFRRSMIVQEANAIGTAYLRADVLDDPFRTNLRTALREYVSQRLELSEPLGNLRSRYAKQPRHRNRRQDVMQVERTRQHLLDVSGA